MMSSPLETSLHEIVVEGKVKVTDPKGQARGLSLAAGSTPDDGLFARGNKVLLELTDDLDDYELGIPVHHHGSTSEYSPSIKSVSASKQSTVAIETPPKRASDDISIQVHFQGVQDELRMRIPRSYSLQEVKNEVVKYWKLVADDFVLQDLDGMTWPANTNILMTRVKEFNLHKKARVRSSPTLTSTPWDLYTTGRTPDRISSADLAEIGPNLWQIFSYYSVQGNPLDLDYLHGTQFVKFARDCQLLHPKVLPSAAVEIIYASESRGKPGTSGMMNFDEFLNALVTLSQMGRSSTSDKRKALQTLLDDFVFPNACRWSLSSWERQTHILKDDKVGELLKEYEEAFFQIFKFYSNSVVASHSQQMGNKMAKWSTAISYQGYLKFMQDFQFSGMKLTSKEIAEIFLCSCFSTPYQPQMENIYGSTASTKQGLSLHSDPVAYATSRSQMNFVAFLEAVGRAAIVALPRVYQIDTINCIKATLQHINRRLRESQVMKIIEQRRGNALYTRDLIAGSIALSSKFFSMWRKDGSPDYLTGKRTINPQLYSRSSATGKMKNNRHRSTSVVTRRQVHSEAKEFPGIHLRGRDLIRQLDYRATLAAELQQDQDQAKDQHEQVPEEWRRREVLPSGASSDYRDTEFHGEDVVAKMPRQQRIQEPSIDKDQVTALLRKGGVFRKYGQWGPPHRRLVSCNEKLDKVCWQALTKKKLNSQKGIKEGLPISQIVEVVPGTSPLVNSVFRKHQSKKDKVSNSTDLLSRCFSLIGQYRRLDLEASSPEEATKWMKALSYIIHQAQDQTE